MKVYIGSVPAPNNWRVDVHDLSKDTTAPLRHHVMHSPDGFGWGYLGSASTELARCILIDATGAEPLRSTVLRFRNDVVSMLDKDRGFRLSENAVLTWYRNHAEPEE